MIRLPAQPQSRLSPRRSPTPTPTHTPTRGWLLALTAALSLAAAPVSAQAPEPGRPVPAWLLAGPFPADTGDAGLARDYLPDEASLLPAAGEAAPGAKGDSARWVEVAADSLGRVDFNGHYGSEQAHSAAYAAVYITSPADRTVQLVVRSDDDVEVWLGGRRVLHHLVARGVETTADTVTLRLARGPNRLLYKVVNRSGGFGLGAQLAATSPDALADLAFSTSRPSAATLAGPAPSLTVGPVRLADRALLDATGARSTLVVPATVEAARWGGLTGDVAVRLAGDSAALPDSDAATARLRVPWSRLAQAAARAELTVSASVSGAAAPAPLPVRGAADLLLQQFASPIPIDGWRYTTDAAGAAAPASAWRPLPPRADSTAARDPAITALALDASVPRPLAGLTLLLDVAGLTPGAAITLNGRAAEPDSLGRVDACGGPCREGAPLRVSVAVNGDTWWDPPRLYVRDAGWHEIHDGARWLRTFTGDSALAVPGEDVARRLLAAATSPDKKRYHAVVAEALARLEPLAANVRADTIRIVGNSHIDAAWLWRWRETVDVVRNTWGTAVKLMDKYPEMTFAASAARYYAWLDSVAPDTLRQIRDLVDQGRWALVGGWWVEPDANMPSGESLVRQGLYGQRAFKRYFGRTATVGWIPDTFGYDWQLPQILHLQGMDYFVTQKLRWNDTNKWPADLNLFWWQGRDGTRVLTYIPYGYDHDLDPRTLAEQWIDTKDSTAVPQMLTLYGVGDHGGGPTMQMLDRERRTARLPGFPTLEGTTPRAALERMRLAADSLPAEPSPNPGGGVRPALHSGVPVVDDELYLEYHRGVFTTQSAMKAWNRHMESLLAAAEAAATAATAAPRAAAAAPAPPAGPAADDADAARTGTGAAFAYPRAALTDAWEKTLFNQFHDLLPGSGIAPIYADAMVDYHAADAEASGALHGALRALAARLDTRPPMPGLVPYIVFNPSGTPRSGDVALSVRPAVPPGDGVPAPPRDLAAYDADGHAVASALRGDTLYARAEGVPATGATLLFVGPAVRRPLGARPRPTGAAASRARTSPGSPVILENAFLRLEIDPATGDIARLYDKRAGREVFAAGQRANRLVMLHDLPSHWDAWNIDDLNGARTPVDRDATVGAVAHDGLGESVVVTRGADSVRVTQRYVLPDSAARVDVVTTVDWHTAHELLKAVFPLGLSPDSVWAEIPYGAIGRPTRAVTSKDSARFEVPMHRWVDASARGFGVALANDAKYGYDAHGDTIRLTLLRAPKYPDPNADMGTHTFTYSIAPHSGDWTSDAVRDAALALNEPLRAERVDPHAGAGRVLPGLVEVVGEGVELGALKRAEDDDAAILRVVETHGREADVTLRFADGRRVVLQETDLLERPDGPPLTGAGSVTVHLRPWQIRTYAVIPGG